jgi:hypothetical protein
MVKQYIGEHLQSASLTNHVSRAVDDLPILVLLSGILENKYTVEVLPTNFTIILSHELSPLLKKNIIIPIYGSMIYVARYVMLLMRANPLRGKWDGAAGHGNRDFFGPCEMAHCKKV